MARAPPDGGTAARRAKKAALAGGPAAQGLDAARPADGAVYHAALAAFEKPLFELALERTEGNQLRAARLLGINRNTLRKRLSELDIAPETFTRRR